MKDTNIFLIRHGDTGKDPWQQVPGDSISKWGRKEVEHLDKSLKNLSTITAYFSSPYQRALDTAEIVSAGKRFRVDNRLREIPLWASPKDLQKDERRLELAKILVEAQEGIEDILSIVKRKHAGEDVAMVCHGNIIRAFLAFTLKMGLETIVRLNVSTASVSVLRGREGAWQLSLFNYKPFSFEAGRKDHFVANYL
ncbi:MAG: histidine phosphatase family protein [Patescibacteria group bacterium]